MSEPETQAQYARHVLNIRMRALFLILERHFWNGDRDKAEAELCAFILEASRLTDTHGSVTETAEVEALAREFFKDPRVGLLGPRERERDIAALTGRISTFLRRHDEAMLVCTDCKEYRAVHERKAAALRERGDKMAEAADWALNVICGVGKGGGEPEPDEQSDAYDALRDALVAYRAGQGEQG
jgi:hypothetical protein